jgi:hypothetical protein
MVSGRVERVEPDEQETVGSLDQHKSDFVGWESSTCRLKVHPRISTVCPKRNIIKRREPRDVIAQAQASKRVEVLTGGCWEWVRESREGEYRLIPEAQKGEV